MLQRCSPVIAREHLPQGMARAVQAGLDRAGAHAHRLGDFVLVEAAVIGEHKHGPLVDRHTASGLTAGRDKGSCGEPTVRSWKL